MTTCRVPQRYHAHIYEAPRGPGLLALRVRATKQLGGVEVGRLHKGPIGPHTRAMFQIAFEPEQLRNVLPWLMHHRGESPVLIHPVHGDPRREHSEDALWLGAPVALDLDIF